MASDFDFVEFVADQMGNAGAIAYRKIFGEYALYSNGKIVALVCDNQLFVMSTEAGRSFIGNVVEAPPYPGAKPSFLIAEQLEDKDRISSLINMTEKDCLSPNQRRSQNGRVAVTRDSSFKFVPALRASIGLCSATPHNLGVRRQLSLRRHELN